MGLETDIKPYYSQYLTEYVHLYDNKGWYQHQVIMMITAWFQLSHSYLIVVVISEGVSCSGMRSDDVCGDKSVPKAWHRQTNLLIRI